MKHYRYLVMQSNDRNSVGFLTASLSGSHRCAKVDTNITDFNPHDFGGGHDNDNYWNTPEDLLVGFSNWFLRKEEKTSYNMGNRFYAATNTYRFFRAEDDVFNADEIDAANLDLKSYEITEAQFILGIQGSYAYKQVSDMFSGNKVKRPLAEPVKVNVVLNAEHKTWCWVSDYLDKKDYEFLLTHEVSVPVGLHYDEAINYISEFYQGSGYRSGGNDSYYKRKALEAKFND